MLREAIKRRFSIIKINNRQEQEDYIKNHIGKPITYANLEEPEPSKIKHWQIVKPKIDQPKAK